MSTRRLILVSNRLPFRVTEKKGRIEFSPSSGGLVSSIKSYIQKTNTLNEFKKENCPLWIGTSDVAEKKFQGHLQAGSIFHDDFELAPVFISASIKVNFITAFVMIPFGPCFIIFLLMQSFRMTILKITRRPMKCFVKR